MPAPGTQYSLFESVEAIPVEGKAPESLGRRFSDYVVYVDESGDHSLTSIDKDYPIFVLAFCIFHKRHYAEKVIPAIEKLKFNYFGHDSVVLHENEICKQKGDFAFLTHLPTRNAFMASLTSIMEASNFIFISCVVDKARLSRGAGGPPNPYHIALGICLEALHGFLVEKVQEHVKTHVVVECRGRKEDEVARPVGLSYLRPQQPNQAFDILKKKLFCDGGRACVGQGYENVGLMIHPPRKAKSPDEPTEA